MRIGKARRRAIAMCSRRRVRVIQAAALMPSPQVQPSSPPPWAQSLARRQRTTQAGLVAAQALREGDRPTSGSGPDLKDKS